MSIRSLAFFNGTPCAVTGEWLAPPPSPRRANGSRPTRRTKSGDSQMASSRDLLPATSGDFSMATDIPAGLAVRESICTEMMKAVAMAAQAKRAAHDPWQPQ
jgi:hypothetical protein